MKYIMFAALSLFSLVGCASGDNTSTAPQTTAQDDQYDYTQDLDIAKVVRISNARNVATECGPVVTHMVYLDSKGESHQLQYVRLGDGCQNG